jgi:hypothetical protein
MSEEQVRKDIYINCSEISSFIGQNKWDYWSSFIKLWKKIDSKNYKACEELSQTEGEFVQNDKLKELQDTLGNEFIQETMKNTNNKSDMIKHITTSSEVIDKLDIPEEKKVQLKVNMESLVNTSFGVSNECGALGLYEMKYKVILDKSQAFKKVLIGTSDNYNWYICGKVDGILPNVKLIEVKTRTKCFFKDVRDYEMTQMQVYMHMFDMNAVDLVEYMPQNRIKIKVTPITKNDKSITKILQKINIFTNKFEEFLNYTLEDKYNFFKMDVDDKKTFLNNLYLKNMK